MFAIAVREIEGSPKDVQTFELSFRIMRGVQKVRVAPSNF
jgi:hypothetical protein